MEVIKKRILQVLTTGITATTGGNKYIIIPDTGVTYNIKIGIANVDEDIGFFDTYMLNSAYDYIFLSGATSGITEQNVAKFVSVLTGGTTLAASGLPIVHQNVGYVTGGTMFNSGITVTGTSTSRLAELRKYTISSIFSKQYITGGTVNYDGVDVAQSNTGSSITYFLGGIKYIDIMSGSTSGTTFCIYTPQGITDANFVNLLYYKNPNKENIISQPNIDDDVFIVRQQLSAFDQNYRLEYIKNLSDLTTYAGGNFFNIVNNS